MNFAVPVAELCPADFGIDAPLVLSALAATRVAAIAAAAWAGRGDATAADAAATRAMRRALSSAPGAGTVVTGEGAKDGAPMLADGETVGSGNGPEFDLAVDPLECTSLCAAGLPGALATIAIAPKGAMWSPGPAYYMDKLVLPAAARNAADLTDSTEQIVCKVANSLGKTTSELRVVVLDKPRHRELVSTVRAVGVAVVTPTAGDVAGALSVILPSGGADLLLGIGGTPEGVMTACAASAVGAGMQGRIAPQREDERERVDAAGLSRTEILELDDLVSAGGAFVATGVTGGLLAQPRRHGGTITTDSLIVAGGAIRRIHQTSRTEE